MTIGQAKRVVCQVRPEIDETGNFKIPENLDDYYLGETTASQKISIKKHNESDAAANPTVYYEPHSVKLARLKLVDFSEKHFVAGIFDSDIVNDTRNILFNTSLPTILLPLKEDRLNLLSKKSRPSLALLETVVTAKVTSETVDAFAEGQHYDGSKEVIQLKRRQSKRKYEPGNGREDKENGRIGGSQGTIGKDMNAQVTMSCGPRVYGFKHYISKFTEPINYYSDDPSAISAYDFEAYFCHDDKYYPQHQNSSVIQSFLQRHDHIADIAPVSAETIFVDSEMEAAGITNDPKEMDMVVFDFVYTPSPSEREHTTAAIYDRTDGSTTIQDSGNFWLLTSLHKVLTKSCCIKTMSTDYNRGEEYNYFSAIVPSKENMDSSSDCSYNMGGGHGVIQQAVGEILAGPDDDGLYNNYQAEVCSYETEHSKEANIR